jgi:hypothetical protein
MNKTEKFITHFIIIWVIVFSLFSERMILHLNTGGRGVLQLFVLLTPVFAFVLFFLTKGRVISFFNKTKFIIYFLPYLLLTLTFPLLGVLFNEYPVRIIFGSMAAVNGLALIMLGYWIGTNLNKHNNVQQLIERYLFISVLLQFLYSLGQYLYRNGTIGSIWSKFNKWDMDLTFSSGLDMVYSRSTGFYLNANILGFWAVVFIWASTLLIKTKPLRLICQILSLLVLIFSQSRGAIGALLISFVFVTLFRLFINRRVNNPIKTVFNFLLVIFAGMYLFNSGAIEVTLLNRFQSALGIFTSGASSDVNFNIRLMVWKEALEWLHQYPLGTFGSPELKFGNFIDNDWVRLLLQGGIIYPFSLLMLILGSLSLMKYSNYGYFIGVISIVIAVCGFTQTPLAYTPLSIFWFFLGVVTSYKKKEESVVIQEKKKQYIA